jgi:hypothetical protein
MVGGAGLGADDLLVFFVGFFVVALSFVLVVASVPVLFLYCSCTVLVLFLYCSGFCSLSFSCGKCVPGNNETTVNCKKAKTGKRN